MRAQLPPLQTSPIAVPLFEALVSVSSLCSIPFSLKTHPLTPVLSGEQLAVVIVRFSRFDDRDDSKLPWNTGRQSPATSKAEASYALIELPTNQGAARAHSPT